MSVKTGLARSSFLAMLAHLNNLLPASHQIDPAYVHAIAAKGFSEALQQHVMLDRLEARLRTLDTVCPPPPRNPRLKHY